MAQNLTNILEVGLGVRDRVCLCVCLSVCLSVCPSVDHAKTAGCINNMLLCKVVTNCMRNVLHPSFFGKVAKKRQKKPKNHFPYK